MIQHSTVFYTAHDLLLLGALRSFFQISIQDSMLATANVVAPRWEWMLETGYCWLEAAES